MIDKSIEYAEHLEQAVISGKGVEPLTALDPALTLTEAYHVQLATIDRQEGESRKQNHR